MVMNRKIDSYSKLIFLYFISKIYFCNVGSKMIKIFNLIFLKKIEVPVFLWNCNVLSSTGVAQLLAGATFAFTRDDQSQKFLYNHFCSQRKSILIPSLSSSLDLTLINSLSLSL